MVSEEYLLHDALNNSVVAAVDAVSKNVKTGYGYTPFGKGFATHSAATQNPILFAGAEANESGSVIHSFPKARPLNEEVIYVFRRPSSAIPPPARPQTAVRAKAGPLRDRI